MVMQAARELRLFQMGSDMLIGHLLKSGLKKVHLLHIIGLISFHSLKTIIGTSGSRDLTSSSVQARPPPVDEYLRFLGTPKSWRLTASRGESTFCWIRCTTRAGEAMVMEGDMIFN